MARIAQILSATEKGSRELEELKTHFPKKPKPAKKLSAQSMQFKLAMVREAAEKGDIERLRKIFQYSNSKASTDVRERTVMFKALEALQKLV